MTSITYEPLMVKALAELSNTPHLISITITPFVSWLALHRVPTCERIYSGYSVVSPKSLNSIIHKSIQNLLPFSLLGGGCCRSLSWAAFWRSELASYSVREQGIAGGFGVREERGGAPLVGRTRHELWIGIPSAWTAQHWSAAVRTG